MFKPRIHFRLRTLLVVFSVICVVLAAASQWWWAYIRADAAVRNVERANGVVVYSVFRNEDGSRRDYDGYLYDFVWNWEPLLDRDMFFSVATVDLSGRTVGAPRGALKKLEALQKLRYLSLFGNPRFGDEAVPYLIKLKTLRRLNVKGTAITRDGYVRLREALPNTEVIWDEHCIRPAQP
jgi:hypothetical protein